MKILVTGGAGFIGSHVVDAFLAAGHQVAVVDNLTTGDTRNVNPRARLHVMDLRSAKLAEVFAAERPEVVCHQAAQASVGRSVTDPLFDASVNIGGGLGLLEHEVHGPDVVPRVAPVPLGVEVAEGEDVLFAAGYTGGGVGDLAGDELQPAPRRLVVE